MTHAEQFPLSVYYMWDVQETMPTEDLRTGPKIGGRFLPDKDFGSRRVLWENVRKFSPIAGVYAMTDMADPAHRLDFETVQADLAHIAARWVIDTDEVEYFRLPGQPDVMSQWYGDGPAANMLAERDRMLVREKTEMLIKQMDNMNEYFRIHALTGSLIWPPNDENGAQLAAAEVPVYWGRQALNMTDDFGLLAATSEYGAFEQNASALQGLLSGGLAAAGVAWDQATANIVLDITVIKQLMRKRKFFSTKNMIMICSEDVITRLTFNGTILDWLLGTNRDRRFVTPEEIQTAIKTQWQWSFMTYDSVWEYVKMDEIGDTKPDIHQVPFLPVGDVLILPDPEYMETGVLGHAPAPTNDGDELLKWDNGRYFWTEFLSKPPWTRTMGVGQWSFPLLKNLDRRFLLHAWD